MNFFINDIFYLIPEFFFIAFISLIIVLAMGLKAVYSMRELIRSLTDLSILGLSIFCLLYIFKNTSDSYLANFLLKDSCFLNSVKIVIIILSIITFIISKHFYASRNTVTFELPIVLLFSIFGIITAISANDLVLLYLALEMQSLSIYALVSSRTSSNLSAEAGLKYFILGSFISGFILYSISAIYLFAGTTNIKSLELLLFSTSNLNLQILTFSIILLVAGLLFKLSAAPLHNWTPDVFDGSPSIITLFIATSPKVGVLYLMINLLYTTFYNVSYTWDSLLMVAGIFSIIVGCLGGLYQTKLKRLLAYSTINNMGFILLGLSVGRIAAVEVALFYMIIYVILSLGIFTLIVLYCRNKTGQEIVYINQVSDIYSRNPILGLILGLNLFSLVGIPPLAGFFTKFYLLLMLVSSKLFVLTLFALLMSVATSFYYIRLVNIIFFSKEAWGRVFVMLHENLLLVVYTVFLINTLFLFNVEHVLRVLHVLALTIF